ncbi:MAG: Gfo/Idh/MocA family oxidoreductase [Planctomycetes bacterium]|nr:Gfo/Idh/MocA family oxidoreductase [Planctomycetota bacterium]
MATTKRLGIGIIGTGWVAGAHVDNWKRVDGCEVVAVCSREEENARRFIAEKGLAHAAPYADRARFLKHSGLDVVVLATPHPSHPAETIAAAKAGKHIVIEKPVALDPASLRKMVAAVNAAGVKTSVCFELRWIGLFKNIKAFLQQGLLGDVFHGEVAYNHGCGPWYKQWDWNRRKEISVSAELTAGCHAIDALTWFMGRRVTEVAAMKGCSPKNPLQYEYAPNSTALFRFEDGATGSVHTSIECRNPYHFPIVLQGDKGSINYDKLYTLAWPGQSTWTTIPADLPDSGKVEHHPYQGQFDHFVDCIRRDVRPENDLNACAHVHEICYAIEEAAKQGKTVKVKRTPGT